MFAIETPLGSSRRSLDLHLDLRGLLDGKGEGSGKGKGSRKAPKRGGKKGRNQGKGIEEILSKINSWLRLCLFPFIAVHFFPFLPRQAMESAGSVVSSHSMVFVCVIEFLGRKLWHPVTATAVLDGVRSKAVTRFSGSDVHAYTYTCIRSPVRTSRKRSVRNKQDAQLSQRDRAAGCVTVFAKSRRLELGDNISRTL